VDAVLDENKVDQTENDEVSGDSKQFSGVINETLEASEFDKHNLKFLGNFTKVSILTSKFIKIVQTFLNITSNFG